MHWQPTRNRNHGVRDVETALGFDALKRLLHCWWGWLYVWHLCVCAMTLSDVVDQLKYTYHCWNLVLLAYVPAPCTFLFCYFEFVHDIKLMNIIRVAARNAKQNSQFLQLARKKSRFFSVPHMSYRVVHKKRYPCAECNFCCSVNRPYLSHFEASSIDLCKPSKEIVSSCFATDRFFEISRLSLML
jgi:hypothetical protein